MDGSSPLMSFHVRYVDQSEVDIMKARPQQLKTAFLLYAGHPVCKQNTEHVQHKIGFFINPNKLRFRCELSDKFLFSH